MNEEQKSCPGHDWDEWDKDNMRAEMQCQFCRVTMPEYVEHLETQIYTATDRCQELIRESNRRLDGVLYIQEALK